MCIINSDIAYGSGHINCWTMIIVVTLCIIAACSSNEDQRTLPAGYESLGSIRDPEHPATLRYMRDHIHGPEIVVTLSDQEENAFRRLISDRYFWEDPKGRNAYPHDRIPTLPRVEVDGRIFQFYHGTVTLFLGLSSRQWRIPGHTGAFNIDGYQTLTQMLAALVLLQH